MEVEKINTEKKKVDSPQANLLSSRRWKKEHEHVDQRYNCTSTTRKLKWKSICNYSTPTLVNNMKLETETLSK